MSDLRFDSVTVRFGTGPDAITAVDHVDLVVPAGSVVGLVGESGSGKSTLARTAVGLTPLSEGRVTLGDRDLSRFTRGRRPLQMVFQDPQSSLNPRMTIGESIMEAMPRGTGGTAKERRVEVKRLLELVQLNASWDDVLPSELSGGQRQRVALARALAGQPEVVVADEITSALDVSVQGAILNLLRELRAELGITMLFISHNLSVVRYLSDYVAVMYLGRVVEFGAVDDLLADPQHPYTRDLLSAAALERTPVASGTPLAVDPPDPHDPPTGCVYHPRCSWGPAAREDRQECAVEEPARSGSQPGRHWAACHFAGRLNEPRP